MAREGMTRNLPRGQQIERGRWGRRGAKQSANFWSQHGDLDGVVEEGLHRSPKSSDIEEGDGLRVIAELDAGERLERLFERAETAGCHDERVSKREHHRLALVHRFDDVKLREARVRDFEIDERLRNDADRFAATGEDFVGEHTHQAAMRTAVDECQVARGELSSERLNRLHVGRQARTR